MKLKIFRIQKYQMIASKKYKFKLCNQTKSAHKKYNLISQQNKMNKKTNEEIYSKRNKKTQIEYEHPIKNPKIYK